VGKAAAGLRAAVLPRGVLNTETDPANCG
jgi:hypothetical protein